jgi:hypothetical protein
MSRGPFGQIAQKRFPNRSRRPADRGRLLPSSGGLAVSFPGPVASEWRPSRLRSSGHGRRNTASTSLTKEKASLTGWYVEPVSGNEPLTCRLQGAFVRWLDVANRGPMCHLAGLIVAGDRPPSLGACLRWLPFWLPDPAGSSFVWLQSCSPAASVTGQHSCSGHPGPAAVLAGEGLLRMRGNLCSADPVDYRAAFIRSILLGRVAAQWQHDRRTAG